MIENPIEYKNKLLAQYASKEISLSEIQKECAYWFLETFDTFNNRIAPTPPPDYTEYKNLSYEKRQRIGNDFWFQKNIKDYLDMKEQIKNENTAKLHQLKEMKSYLPPEDFLSISKYNAKIEEFEY